MALTFRGGLAGPVKEKEYVSTVVLSVAVVCYTSLWCNEGDRITAITDV